MGDLTDRKHALVCGTKLLALWLMVAPVGTVLASGEEGSAIDHGQVVFRFEPRIARVPLGRDILFRGTFLVDDPGLLAGLRAAPLVLPWRVVKHGSAVAVLQGEVRIRGARTPLRVGTRPAEPGVYELVFIVVPRSPQWSLRLEHGERNRIEVYAPARGVHPPSVREERRKTNE